MPNVRCKTCLWFNNSNDGIGLCTREIDPKIKSENDYCGMWLFG